MPVDHASAIPLDRVIAVIGCDGSGKSTLSGDLMAAAQKTGAAEFVYLGQSSGNIAHAIETLPLIGPPLVRTLKRKAARTHEGEKKSPGGAAALVIFALSLWRVHKFRRMLRLHKRGALIITDRYPQAEVSGFYYDGPGLDADEAGGGLVRVLAVRERKMYQWMAAHVPALVIRLNIDAQTAHARKPDHKLAMLEKKISVIPNLNFNGAPVLDLDSRTPYPQVLAAATQALADIRNRA